MADTEKQLRISLTGDLHRRMKSRAALEGIRIPELVAAALEAYLRTDPAARADRPTKG